MCAKDMNVPECILLHDWSFFLKIWIQISYSKSFFYIYSRILLSPYLEGAVVFLIIWYLDLQLPVQSVPITTNILSLNPVHGEVYSIQHYVIKFVSDLWQVGGFLLGTPVSSINKTDRHDTTEILLKVALTYNPNP